MIANKVLILLIASLLLQDNIELAHHKEILLLMGTRFEITATASNKNVAKEAVHKGIEEIQRIESLISSWKEDSQTSEINRNAGIQPVKVDKELYDLINRSKKVSKLTQGAFDISFASMYKLYKFDSKEHHLPSEQTRKDAIQFIDHNSIILDQEKSTVFLNKKGMKIGFGAIGKGYAANKAMVLMKAIEGVKGGVINASGDIMVWGENGNNEGWKIQISDPKDINKSIGYINVLEGSVVTSGDYEKYFTSNEIRYSHIINPKTGLPTTGIKSVTIVSQDAELGDALATSVFVMGIENGLNLINRLKNTEALIISDQDSIFHSKNLMFNEY